ncbi:hypothetical protein SDC9_207414 [bioreactor metagenome]|uniref:Uncharacterized protein n=1 Tax=bioreactor metagenome TaxID=1076179 RepID=A0A645J9B0_9ZZZZ
MPVPGQFIHDVKYPRSYSEGRFFAEPHAVSDLVGSYETDAENIDSEPVWIFLKHMDRGAPIMPEYPECVTCSDAVALKEEHDPTHLSLFKPCLMYGRCLLLPDTFNIKQLFRLGIQYLKSISPEK